METTIKMLHVLGQLEPGGVSTWMKGLIEGLQDKNISIDICCNYRKTSGVLVKEFEKLNCDVFHVPLDFNLFKYHQQLVKILQLNKYAIIHDHRSIISGATLRAAKKAGVPVRIAYHHSADDDLPKGFARKIYAALLKRWMLAFATHIWGCSEAAVSALYGDDWRQKDKRIEVVYGGIDFKKPSTDARKKVRMELGIRPEEKVIGFMCRMTRAKNPFIALEVCTRVMIEVPFASVLWVGDGPDLANIKKAVLETNIKERFHFTGFRNDIPDLLSAMDVYFQPSLWEGFPLGTLEALNAGLLIVGSRPPGLLEALPREFHCYCSDANDVDAHVKNLIKILKSGVTKQCPKEWLAKFSIDCFSKTIYSKYILALEHAALAGAK